MSHSWINCLQETWRLTRMSIETIMGKDIITETVITVGKINMAVLEMGADVDV